MAQIAGFHIIIMSYNKGFGKIYIVTVCVSESSTLAIGWLAGLCIYEGELLLYHRKSDFVIATDVGFQSCLESSS